MKFKLVDKFIVLLLIIGLNWFANFDVFKSFAFFNDIEGNNKSTISVSALDFSIESSSDFSPKIKPTQISSKSFDLINKDMEIEYDASIIFDNSIFCQELNLEMERNGDQIYDGLLADFNLFNLNIQSSENDNFNLLISLESSDSSLWGKFCDFDLIFMGNQESGDGFSDTEIISNTVESGVWDKPIVPVVPDVIINEIMWMGSEDDESTRHSGDEWIELRNMTDHDIKIGKWHIDELRDKGRKYMIPASHVIPANGYFLISAHSENSANSDVAVIVDQVNSSLDYIDDYSENGQIVLKDSDGNIIDVTPIPDSSDWPVGENEEEKKWSMERNLVPGDGSEVDSWHTCDPDIMEDDDLATMQSYWNTDAQLYNCGTPGNSNLSKNDPSADDYEPNFQKNLEPVLKSIVSVVEEEEEDGEVAVDDVNGDEVENEGLDNNEAEVDEDSNEACAEEVDGDSENTSENDDENTPHPAGHPSTPEHPLSPGVDSPCQEGNLEDGDEEASDTEETFEEEQEDGDDESNEGGDENDGETTDDESEEMGVEGEDTDEGEQGVDGDEIDEGEQSVESDSSDDSVETGSENEETDQGEEVDDSVDNDQENSADTSGDSEDEGDEQDSDTDSFGIDSDESLPADETGTRDSEDEPEEKQEPTPEPEAKTEPGVEPVSEPDNNPEE